MRVRVSPLPPNIMKVKAHKKEFIEVEIPEYELKRIVYTILEDVYGFGPECYVKDGYIWYGHKEDREVSVKVAKAHEENRRAVEMYAKIHKYWQDKQVYR